MHHEIQLEQGTIRYRDLGSGEPIVFVHGLLADSRLWNGVAERLVAAGHRCILPDWPLGSHVAPMAADADLSPRGLAALIADFIAAIGLDEVTLVANDSGGALSQIVVTEHSERIGRLVLTDCDAFDNFLPPMFRYLQVGARIPGATTLLTQSMRLRFARRLPIAYGWIVKHKLDPDLTKEWVKPVLRSRAARRDVRKFLRGITKKDTLAAAERLHEFKRPVLIAWAPEDRAMPFEHAERLAKLFPDARLQRIEDAWTFVPLDQPERVASAIQAFTAEGSHSAGSVPAGVSPAP